MKGPELVPARTALQKVYVAARGWSQDAKPYRLESSLTSDGNGHDGKSAVWRGSFASASKRTEKSYTWSGSAADGAPSRGINPGTEDTYSATNSSTQVFDIAFLKKDSDEALAVAQKHGGDKIMEKAPDTTVVYVCDWNHNTNELIWHVIYGSPRIAQADGGRERFDRRIHSRGKVVPLGCLLALGPECRLRRNKRRRIALLVPVSFLALELSVDLGEELVQSLG